MAYSELIKNFSRIRVYLRSFYVYGFRHRNEFTQKSARSYDNERRRVESWLGDYMSFGRDAEGRRVFLSVDSRVIKENPLYRAFRTKSSAFPHSGYFEGYWRTVHHRNNGRVVGPDVRV